jgi:hypothetical protein
MGKSAGKWIKSVLLGKKSTKCQGAHGTVAKATGREAPAGFKPWVGHLKLQESALRCYLSKKKEIN